VQTEVYVVLFFRPRVAMIPKAINSPMRSSGKLFGNSGVVVLVVWLLDCCTDPAICPEPGAVIFAVQGEHPLPLTCVTVSVPVHVPVNWPVADSVP